MKRLAMMMTVVGLALGAAACGDSDDDTGSDSTEVSAAPASVPQLSPADGAALLAERSDITIIDVRTPAEFAGPHLEGAVNIDAEGPDFDSQAGELDPDAAYAVYCQSGRRSALAAARLVALGFSDVHDLGGIQAWVDAGNPVVGS